MTKKALITGITGQDGSYLSELLLSKGYEVHGIVRRSSTVNTGRIGHILDRLNLNYNLHYGDLSDSEQITNIIHNVKPDEVYNLGAQSHVGTSAEMPEYTGNITGLGTARVLEAIRRSGSDIKFYQASSSEMFGGAKSPLNESAPFMPRSPYGCAKLYAYWMTRIYREGYGMFAVNGIMFNHESPRRGDMFVTKKITHGIAEILAGRSKEISLGNLDARRDWGFAPEYVELMVQMLDQNTPDDYVVGTGETHSVKEFLDEAFAYADLDVEKYVRFDSRHTRPIDVDILIADSSKAKRVLRWEPKIKFKELVKIMVDANLREAGLHAARYHYGDGDKILDKKFPKRWWTD